MWAKKTVPSSGRKKGCLQVGEKKGAFKWAKKGCLQVGEKKGAFKIKKTGFLEVCVNMLWDSHNFNETRVYLLLNKRTTTEKLKQLVEMLLQSKQKKRLSNNFKKLFLEILLTVSRNHENLKLSAVRVVLNLSSTREN